MAEDILYGRLSRLHRKHIEPMSELADKSKQLLEAVSAGEIPFIKHPGLRCSEANGLLALLFKPYMLHMPESPGSDIERTQLYLGVEWEPSEHDPNFILCYEAGPAAAGTGKNSLLIKRDKDIEEMLSALNKELTWRQDPDLELQRSFPLAGAMTRKLPQPYVISEAQLSLAIDNFIQQKS